jgi:NCS2 family nucleobase:cation symporter-2
MFAGNLAPILILSTVAGGAMGLTVDDKIFLVQMAMFASGVATLIQLYPLGKIGSRLPIVMGTSFSFLGVAIYVGFNYGIAGIFGAALVGSIVEIVLGFTMPYIRKYFTPLITGIVVLGIGFSLLHVGVEYMAGGTAAINAGTVEWKSLFIGMFTLLVMLGFNIFGKGMWKSSAILLGLVIGFLMAIPFDMVDTAIISEADWFLIPTPLRFGLEFHFEAIFLFGAIYIITAMETVGDCSGVTLGGLDREPTSEEVSGSILADAFGSSFAALFGALPNTSFSQNVGIISMTKVVSRYVVMLGAAFLIGAAFFPKFGALFLTIPTPVLGGVLILIFGIIAVNGVRMIAKSDLAGRDGLILALAFGIGFGVTSVPGLVDLFAEGQILDNNFLEWYFADTLIAAGLLAFFLNLVLPKNIEF